MFMSCKANKVDPKKNTHNHNIQRNVSHGVLIRTGYATGTAQPHIVITSNENEKKSGQSRVFRLCRDNFSTTANCLTYFFLPSLHPLSVSFSFVYFVVPSFRQTTENSIKSTTFKIPFWCCDKRVTCNNYQIVVLVTFFSLSFRKNSLSFFMLFFRLSLDSFAVCITLCEL